MSVTEYFIPACSYHFVVAVWRAKEAESATEWAKAYAYVSLPPSLYSRLQSAVLRDPQIQRNLKRHSSRRKLLTKQMAYENMLINRHRRRLHGLLPSGRSQPGR